MYSDRSLINRRNVTSDAKNSYRANRDFLMTIIKSRVVVGAMKVIGFKSKDGNPENFPLPNNPDAMTKAEKLNYLLELSAKIVDELVYTNRSVEIVTSGLIKEQQIAEIKKNQNLTADGRFPCRFPGCKRSFKYDGRSRRNHEQLHGLQTPDTRDYELEDRTNASATPDAPGMHMINDDIFSYNCALLTDGLFFLNFLDAIKEGDGARLMRQYKYLMLYCKADSHSSKYALECLHQLFTTMALLSPRDSERFVWNRFVNNANMRGTNIPLDLDVEHSNNVVKQGIKNLGPNLTEKSISRICNAESATRTITEKLDAALQQLKKSGRHANVSTNKDVEVLIKRAVEADIFSQIDSRSYKHFSHFCRDELAHLDPSELFKWINNHKKNVYSSSKAR